MPCGLFGAHIVSFSSARHRSSERNRGALSQSEYVTGPGRSAEPSGSVSPLGGWRGDGHGPTQNTHGRRVPAGGKPTAGDDGRLGRGLRPTAWSKPLKVHRMVQARATARGRAIRQRQEGRERRRRRDPRESGQPDGCSRIPGALRGETRAGADGGANRRGRRNGEDGT